MTDPAVASARSVVGLYGDPTVSWSIGLDATFTSAYDVPRLLERCREVVLAHPGLGRPPVPVPLASGEEDSPLPALLDGFYGDQDPLVRVAYAETGDRLIVAAHHGGVDGLGLLALMSLLVDEDVVSTARGIGDRSSSAGFVRSSLARLAEGLFRPPSRLAASRSGRPTSTRTSGDVVALRDLPLTSASTARVIAASAAAVADWNEAHAARADRLVVAVGASRRDGRVAVPDRNTAYLRVRLRGPVGADDVTRLLDSTDPEPAFPERPASRAVTIVTRALRSRLGSSLLISNLGLLRVPPSVERIAFYPTAAGPRSLAVGVASTATYTTVTVRMPSADFDASAAEAVCALIADRLLQYGS